VTPDDQRHAGQEGSGGSHIELLRSVGVDRDDPASMSPHGLRDQIGGAWSQSPTGRPALRYRNMLVDKRSLGEEGREWAGLRRGQHAHDVRSYVLEDRGEASGGASQPSRQGNEDDDPTAVGIGPNTVLDPTHVFRDDTAGGFQRRSTSQTALTWTGASRKTPLGGRSSAGPATSKCAAGCQLISWRSERSKMDTHR
jgi:hypothetical protein